MTNAKGTLDDVYLEWLYGQIGAVGNENPHRSYWNLARQLFTKRFVWFVHNDDNRVEDGRELRHEFLTTTGFELEDPYDLFMTLECSMLEMLIALAQRAAFEDDSTTLEWFWRFMYNLGLDRYTDSRWGPSAEEEVEEALDRVIQRTYSYDGVGGLFPLRSPERDQRKVELWYQKEAYLLEGIYVNVVPTV